MATIPGTLPPAPGSLTVSSITMRSFIFKFTSRGTGGTPIQEWQVAYSTRASEKQRYIRSTGTTTFTGLSPATTYYLWARGRNRKGWGPWSVRAQVTTDAGAMVKDKGVWKKAVPYIKLGGVWYIAQPYVKQNGTWGITDG